MAIAETGPLALKLTIRAEELVKTPSLPEVDVSTREISESAGFDEPDAFSEFYGYSSAILPTMASARNSTPNDNYFAIYATPATNGFVPITSRGFYFGTDSRGPTYNTRYQVDTSNSLGEFSKGMGGLAANRTYYYWGYVQNQIGEGYTARYSARTLPAIAINNFSSNSNQMYLNGMHDWFFYSGGWGDGNSILNKSEWGWDNRFYITTEAWHYAGFQYNHPYYGWVNAGSYSNRVYYEAYRNFYGSGDNYWEYGAMPRYASWNVTLKNAPNATRHRRFHDMRLQQNYGESCCTTFTLGSGTVFDHDISYMNANNSATTDQSTGHYCYSCTQYFTEYPSYGSSIYYGKAMTAYNAIKHNSQYSSMRMRYLANWYGYSQ